MPRQPRQLQAGYCYHVTTRCNNREFRLTSTECRNVFLYAIGKAIGKFKFKLYALCIMSNHVHYLLEPVEPEDLPKIMHWLNWYTAMCFNRILNRTGHFWEKRYYSSGFDKKDHNRALNTLRYIHANPKSAGMRQGFFYNFSNYGSYDRLTDDGLTEWHPSFLALGRTLDECAHNYRGFCRRYKPQPKSQKRKRSHWGSKLLPVVSQPKGKKSAGQMTLPWAFWDSPPEAISLVAEKFVLANGYPTTVPDIVQATGGGEI